MFFDLSTSILQIFINELTQQLLYTTLTSLKQPCSCDFLLLPFLVFFFCFLLFFTVFSSFLRSLAFMNELHWLKLLKLNSFAGAVCAHLFIYSGEKACSMQLLLLLFCIIFVMCFLQFFVFFVLKYRISYEKNCISSHFYYYFVFSLLPFFRCATSSVTSSTEIPHICWSSKNFHLQWAQPGVWNLQFEILYFFCSPLPVQRWVVKKLCCRRDSRCGAGWECDALVMNCENRK